MTIANLVPQERVYSDERDAIILRDYAAGVPRDVILARVCELPGPLPKNARAIKTRAHIIGAKRPEPAQNASFLTWPDARRNLAFDLFQDAAVPWPRIVARLNDDFPGLPRVSEKSIEEKCRKAGLRRPYARRPKPSHFAGNNRRLGLDQPMQSNLPATLDAKIEKAARMIGDRGRDVHVWSVVAHTGLEPWQVCMVAGRIAMGLPLR